MLDESMKSSEFLNDAGEGHLPQDLDNPSKFEGVMSALKASVGKRRRSFFALSLALNIILIDRLIFAKVTTLEDYFAMNSPFFTYPSIILTIVSAVIFGWAVAKRIMSFEYASVITSRLAWFQILLGGAFLILSVGCPNCDSPLFSTIGMQGGLGIFPLGGLELKLLAILLLWSSLTLVTKSERSVEIAVDAELVEDQLVLDQPRKSLLQRIRPTLLPVVVIVAVLSLPLLPPTWKFDFSNDDISPPTLSTEGASEISLAGLIEQVLPPDGYDLGVNYSEIGPQLLESGAIDLDRFIERYEQGGAPLSDFQVKILTEKVNEPIIINQDNAHFLLNFFWALGLTNKNPILDDGPMMAYSEGEIGRFASTGGWSLGQKDPTELYSSTAIIQLSPEQQELVEEVAAVVYRPCCNNPTIFPDCNHGMAMLGMLELLAANGLGADQLMDAAKYFNAFWFPQQSIEVATYFQTTQGLSFSEVDPELVVGPQIFSGSGFQALHAWLGENGLLAQAPNQGGSCGV
ncbi:MAG: hypothetical protein GTO18_17910 [Anaerolineales bacterium]|nr:hypothetical protein [Anaerolineales bacterium]